MGSDESWHYFHVRGIGEFGREYGVDKRVYSPSGIEPFPLEQDDPKKWARYGRNLVTGESGFKRP